MGVRESMNDDEFYAEKARLESFVNVWVPRLGLSTWRLTCAYRREPIADSSDDWTPLASTNTKWEYEQAEIQFDCVATSQLDDDDIEEVVVHELAHVVVNQMRPWNQKNWERQHEELVVTRIASAFLRTLQSAVCSPLELSDEVE